MQILFVTAFHEFKDNLFFGFCKSESEKEIAGGDLCRPLTDYILLVSICLRTQGIQIVCLLRMKIILYRHDEALLAENPPKSPLFFVDGKSSV